jgi:rhodanese-related sulfurtransferase
VEDSRPSKNAGIPLLFITTKTDKHGKLIQKLVWEHGVKQSIPDLQKKGRPVITCCLSGARSGMAKALLASAGLEVYNGGNWSALEKQIRQIDFT